MGFWNSIKEKFDEADRRTEEWIESKLDFDEERLQTLVESAQGESVTRDAFLIVLDGFVAPINLLDDEEQPHYFLNGSTVDVEGQGAGSESIVGWDRDRRIGGAYTILTSQRILVIANHARGYDEHTIPYDIVTAVNLNRGMVGIRLSIQTKSATYHCSATKTKNKYGSEEVESAVDYLRKKRQQTTEEDSDDALDQITRLKSLYDDGAITEEEFQEKKQSLLDDI
ncbi:SHOCT domain-containing protein [Halobellus rubicundus]|uniref:SHOCT domain-containing protein n=1 Tax=Halobellus rubicundus TaxID=2996466 RepID=A0ABD5MFV0_9EURY